MCVLTHFNHKLQKVCILMFMLKRLKQSDILNDKELWNINFSNILMCVKTKNLMVISKRNSNIYWILNGGMCMIIFVAAIIEAHHNIL